MAYISSDGYLADAFAQNDRKRARSSVSVFFSFMEST